MNIYFFFIISFNNRKESPMNKAIEDNKQFFETNDNKNHAEIKEFEVPKMESKIYNVTGSEKGITWGKFNQSMDKSYPICLFPNLFF